MSRPPSVPAGYSALLRMLRTSDAVWNASRTFFAQWDLSPAQFNLLNLLTDQPEGLTQSDLSRALLSHRSNITGLVDRLERRGLVRRREQESDRRAWRVVLAPAGQRLMKEILPAYYRAAAAVWRGVSERQTAEFASVLALISANAEIAAENLRSRTL